ncbi:MAG TPA: hypothetical protein VL651_15645, partial [Bacteroidia bacterium]|nr:hypothetical protein [Bacteroidia bacterium]
MRKYFLVAVLFSLVMSCKKDDDSTPPTISVSAPIEGAQYNVFDTLTVTFSTTDDQQLDHYSVKLTDVNLSPVEPEVTASLSGRSQNVSFQMVIDNLHILTGTHYVMIQVSDG